jgi:soluble lytic murein transglycosylase
MTTRARATAIGVAFAAVLWPVHAPTQSAAAALWLAPAGKPSAATTAFARAVNELADGKAGAALPVFSRATSDPVLGGYALLLQGRAELALRKPAEAKFSADQLLKVEPRDYLRESALVLKADVAEAAGDSTDEMRALQGVAEMKPLSGAAVYLRLGRAAKQAGERTVALNAFRKVVYEFALSPEATDAATELTSLADPGAVPNRDGISQDLGRGEQLYAVKRFADARKVFDQIRPVAVGAERDLVALRIAECDLGLKKFAAARSGLEPLLDRSDRRAEANYAMLGTLRGLNRKDEFVSETRRFVAAFADTSWAEAALNDLATFYILEDDDAAAAKVFVEMYRSYPSGAFAERAAWRSGWWAYTSGDYAETVRVFDDAFTRFARSDYRSAWSYWAARSRQQLGQRETAAEGYRRVIGLYQNSYYGREAARGLAAMTGATGAGVARARLEAPLALSPGEPPDNARLITRLLEVGLYDEAIGELKRAERDLGNTPVLVATEAYAWNRKGELRTAITLMKRAYPQFMAAGGETLPVEIRRVIFPMQYWDLIQKYAVGRGLDPHVMAALITQESTFQADVKSGANAWGLMQILPSTGRSYAPKAGVRPWRVSKLTNPDVNIRIGMAYFADLVKQYDGIVGALVAYNAGGSRYRRWVQEYPGADRDEFIDNIPFFETQNYLKRILGTADDFRALYPRTSSARGH